MNEQQASEAVTKWIGDRLSIVEEARYPYPVALKTGPLTTTRPDVACLAERKRIQTARAAAATFPAHELVLQQVELVRVFNMAASVMLAVENDEDDQSALEVFQRLQGYGETLELALLAHASDGESLSAVVPMVSPECEFDYSAVFAETDDGLRGRMLTISLTIGEIVDEAGVLE